MYQVIETNPFEEIPTTEEEATALYRDLVRARAFDERALSLQRQGWMSSYPQFSGQEASQVGAAHAMNKEDPLFPTYRANAMQIARGVPMSDILLFRRGHSEYSSDHDLPIFPQAIPIATQIPHAAGAGMAADYMDEDHSILCYLGDGATSEGDFHEGLNFAGVFEAPVVFFCENNGWAISLPRRRQTASATLAQKADAYGLDGIRVDGNDPIAVKHAVERSIERVREGMPVLIESLTYRQGAHSTSDDPSRYEHTGADLPAWRTADPLERFETYLREGSVLDDERVAAIENEAEAELDEAVETAEETPPPGPEGLFDSVFAEPTPPLREQQTWLESFVAEHGHPGSDS
jgi:pyruvate dehydrogenase E1 component alpha subunit